MSKMEVDQGVVLLNGTLSVEFCTKYLSNVESIWLPKSRHLGRTVRETVIGNKIFIQRTK